jgi:hypothetical protein
MADLRRTLGLVCALLQEGVVTAASLFTLQVTPTPAELSTTEP